METGGRLVLSKAGDRARSSEVLGKGYVTSFEGDQNILKLIVVMV